MTVGRRRHGVVYKDAAVWRWTCSLPGCCRSEWHVRHDQAVAELGTHLSGHRMFGFRGKQEGARDGRG